MLWVFNKSVDPGQMPCSVADIDPILQYLLRPVGSENSTDTAA